MRRLALLSTAPPADLVRELPPGTELVPGPLPGTTGAVLTVPADVVSADVRALRRRLAIGPRGALVGHAVADAGSVPDAELLQVAARALVAGHGVADDLDEQDRRTARRATRRRAVVRARYERLGTAQRRIALVAVGLGLGWGVPFTLYAVVWWSTGLDLGPYAYFVVLVALLLMAASIVAECLQALEPDRLPDPGKDGHSASDPLSSGLWPTVTVVLAAYLPNEVDVLPASVDVLLAHDYAGHLDVVVAANGTGPEADRAMAWLRGRAAQDPRLRVVFSPSSTSKAENVNAALHASWAVSEGGVVGVLDADHQLTPGAVARAARWIAGGYADVVQGHNVVRNGSRGWLTQTVAVEFEAIYAVAHPGRAGLHGFGIFGGSNGFWRADLLDRLRMRPWMLTEDIDVSLRAVLEGARVTSDPRLVSRELAPETPAALWDQRMRWAQGWHQTSRRYLRPMLNSPALSARQRTGAVLLLGWREVYPWVALQMFPVIGYQILVTHDPDLHWFLPFFVFTSLFTTGVGPLQALAAWRLSAPEIRSQGAWYARYLLLTGALYGEVKAFVNRAAHLRQWLGDDGWVVTPRGGPAVVHDESAPAVLQLPRVHAVDRDGVVRARTLRRPSTATAERRRRSTSLPGGVERRSQPARTASREVAGR